MLVIRDSQLKVLAAAQERAFLDRVADFIGSQMERKVARKDLEALLARGRGYGLVSERDLGGYMFVGAVSGTARKEADPRWIQRIMRADWLRPSARIETLYEVAKGVWTQALIMRSQPWAS